MQSDAELVKAVLNGDKDAFARLVRRYERPVRAEAIYVLGDYHSAADVSQNALLRAYEQLPRLRKHGCFGSWLLTITRRCALDFVRQRPKENRLETAGAPVVESSNGELDEAKQRLLSAVVKLPKAEEQVVMLRYFAGNSVKDVARILDRSVGTVTKQLSRAHKHLQYILEGPE
jgi:RNA polymerase sigma-70 factor (ECF subfamily)